ncbi:MAG: hypothetical protein EOP10_16920 [Proteobacteria bacterium]|nr:MAG: hypothetical protein EOP10_16920 [Pseudomonadota bacterium]
MRGKILVTLLSLSALGTACSEESVASKYIKESGTATVTPAPAPVPDPVDPTPDTTTGDSAAGLTVINGPCAACHGSGVATTVLDKTAVAKLDAAKTQALHTADIKKNFEGTPRLNLEAALKTK